MLPTLVLVVEDDFLIRLNTTEILCDAGFEVLEAADAATALDVLQTTPGIRLVCTDVQMPGAIDGVELALHVREKYPQIGVIITSSCSRHKDRASDVPFLLKPFLASRLVNLARQHLGIGAAPGEEQPCPRWLASA